MCRLQPAVRKRRWPTFQFGSPTRGSQNTSQKYQTNTPEIANTLGKEKMQGTKEDWEGSRQSPAYRQSRHRGKVGQRWSFQSVNQMQMYPILNPAISLLIFYLTDVKALHTILFFWKWFEAPISLFQFTESIPLCIMLLSRNPKKQLTYSLAISHKVMPARLCCCIYLALLSCPSIWLCYLF